MGIEVLIFEKSTLSRRAPFDTLGIYACPSKETNKNQSLKTNDMKQLAFHKGQNRKTDQAPDTVDDCGRTPANAGTVTERRLLWEEKCARKSGDGIN
jgi:hypothetical protein